jgi:chemotaxis protein histidine kinase CheA
VLRAERRRDWVALHLTDDGRGVDGSQVATRARALGLLEDAGPLSADDQLALLARPGFTLKNEVTAVSGRGVGMDVVLTAVRGLGGRVEMRSRLGKGTTFTLVMPHTTAVQRLLLVQVGGERYALPFRVVTEAAQPDGKALAAAGTRGEFSFRGRSIPFQDLGAVVGAPLTRDRRRPVLVLEWGERQAVIAVDALLGQMDLLIERVEAPVGLPAWVSGATILADGSPAFVLDPTALF